MNLSTIATVLISFIPFIFALTEQTEKCPKASSHSLSSTLEASRACTLQLEAVIYQPTTNVSQYMAKIADAIKADIRNIMNAFAAGDLDYVKKFIRLYGIYITIYTPIGNPVLVAPTYTAFTNPFQNVSVSKTYLKEDGFYVDTVRGFYNYQFVLRSKDGQFLGFVISLPTAAMTNFPVSC